MARYAASQIERLKRFPKEAASTESVWKKYWNSLFGEEFFPSCEIPYNAHLERSEFPQKQEKVAP